VAYTLGSGAKGLPMSSKVGEFEAAEIGEELHRNGGQREGVRGHEPSSQADAREPVAGTLALWPHEPHRTSLRITEVRRPLFTRRLVTRSDRVETVPKRLHIVAEEIRNALY
jgi:hypothetical protein